MDDATANDYARILAQVATVYHCILEEHGPSASGVGWADSEAQAFRFGVLTSRIDPELSLIVNDVGCGSGDLFPYLDSHFRLAGYVGLDVCEAMVVAANERIKDPRTAFIQNAVPATPAHWSLASGTFNISAGADEAAWRELTGEVIRRMAGFSLRGFAFNMLRPHRRDAFFWGDEPEPWEAFCRDGLGGQVERIEHPGGEEWSLIVRRV
ncbi:hypothetical protein CU669_03050 [Paramagnetospirillum kuznetsovii]|uniref:Methyltransferase domain-containing protein n=1 Tax=Paramagnetospirillum kuznetsovii TaxID=2053833 RepID=A0A364P220_9PROT|nr:class I SAM-dependent methyltransferase [Paramagnetospirillum kuznetsovii]RAU23155.1 hypothetical protein CU669_03050 [Paramagnetospirillum kuznetsovii]